MTYDKVLEEAQSEMAYHITMREREKATVMTIAEGVVESMGCKKFFDDPDPWIRRNDWNDQELYCVWTKFIDNVVHTATVVLMINYHGSRIMGKSGMEYRKRKSEIANYVIDYMEDNLDELRDGNIEYLRKRYEPILPDWAIISDKWKGK